MKKIDAPTFVAMPVGAILLGFFWNDVLQWQPMSTEVVIAGGMVIGAIIRYALAWIPSPGATAEPADK